MKKINPIKFLKGIFIFVLDEETEVEGGLRLPCQKENYNVNQAFNKLSKQILEYDGKGFIKYNKILIDFARIVVTLYNLNSTKVKFDLSLLGEARKGYVNHMILHNGKDYLYLNPIILKPAKTFQQLIINLNILAHELGHIYDYKKNPFTYQKFDNEKGHEAWKNSGTAFNILMNYLNLKDEKDDFFLSRLSSLYYLNSRHERMARKSSDIAMQSIYSKMQQIYALTKPTPRKTANLKSMKYLIEENKEYEAFSKSSLITLFKDPKFTELKDLIDACIEDYAAPYSKNLPLTETDIRKKMFNVAFKTNPEMLIHILEIPELSEQKHKNTVFDFWLLNYEFYLPQIFKLISLKSNKNSKTQLRKLFARVYSQDGEEGLDYILEEYDANNFPCKIARTHLENEYNKHILSEHIKSEKDIQK